MDTRWYLRCVALVGWLTLAWCMSIGSAEAQSVVLERNSQGAMRSSPQMLQSNDPFCGWALVVGSGTYAQLDVTFTGQREYGRNQGTFYGPSWNPSSITLDGAYLPSENIQCVADLWAPPGVDVYTPDGSSYSEYHSNPSCDHHPEIVFPQRSAITFFIGLDLANDWPVMAQGVSGGAYHWSYAAGELNFPGLTADYGGQIGVYAGPWLPPLTAGLYSVGEQRIYLNPALDWRGLDFWKFMAAHEFGHAFGFGDATQLDYMTSIMSTNHSGPIGGLLPRDRDKCAIVKSFSVDIRK